MVISFAGILSNSHTFTKLQSDFMYRDCIEKGLIDSDRCPCCKCPSSVDSLRPDPVIDQIVSHYRTLISDGQDELQVCIIHFVHL